MSSSEEENDKLTDLEEIRNKIMSQPPGDRMQVSAWEDDDDGIEADRNARAPDEKAMLNAAENGDLVKVKILLNKNPHLLECVDKDGYTPLHRACYGDHTEVIKYLLQMGAKIDAKTMDKWQPLHSACRWNNVESAAILIENGADINAQSEGDQTPLHLVTSSSYISAALQLFLLNPDINPLLINSSGDTAQDIARRTGKYYPMFEIIEPCMNDI
ncbi:hypothetical protein KM043_002699 [Ampulex compressa]|nr:hypothetical protein KM043_002699 [Ampulex compressa]